MVKAIEVEIDGQFNEALHFRPLQRSIRGKFDLLRIGEPMAKVKASDWPQPIPSQRLGVDPSGVGYLIEPLHDQEHAATRERIERQGMKLEPSLTEFPGIDLPTWLFWIRRAVEDGYAKVVKGSLPEKIDGKPVKNFIVNEPKPGAVDRLTAAIERQSQLFEKLLAKLGEK